MAPDAGPVIVTVGATFLTVSLVVYSVKPPSLSMIRALTGLMAGPSANVQEVEALAPLPAYVAPERSAFAQLKAYRKPAVVSAELGSDCAVNVTTAAVPSFTGPLFPREAVGATLFTTMCTVTGAPLLKLSTS